MSVNSIQQSPQPSLTISLESTGVILSGLVSLTILATVVIKLVSKFNFLNSEIQDLKEQLQESKQLFGELKLLQKEFQSLDKKLDIHIEHYSGHQNVVTLAINGSTELIKHKWERTEEEFQKTNSDVKDLQKYLQQRGDFRIRE